MFVFQTFRAGSIEIISTGSARSPAVGRPVIEIDLGVRRRNRARGGVNNDMVGVTVDRELPGEEEEGVVNDEDEEGVDSSQEEEEYQVDEVDGERIVSADSMEGLEEERLAAVPPPWQAAMPPNLLDARLGGGEALGEAGGGEPNDYRVPPPEGGRPPPPQVSYPQMLSLVLVELNIRIFIEIDVPGLGLTEGLNINMQVEREGMRINIVGAGPAVAGQNPGQGAQERGGYLIIGEVVFQTNHHSILCDIPVTEMVRAPAWWCWSKGKGKGSLFWKSWST